MSSFKVAVTTTLSNSPPVYVAPEMLLTIIPIASYLSITNEFPDVSCDSQ